MKQFLFFAAFLLGMVAYSCQKDSLSTAVYDGTDVQVSDRDSMGGHHHGGGGHHGGGHHHNGDSTHTNHPHDSTHTHHSHDSTHVGHPHDSTQVHHSGDSTCTGHNPHDSIPGGGHPHKKHRHRH